MRRRPATATTTPQKSSAFPSEPEVWKRVNRAPLQGVPLFAAGLITLLQGCATTETNGGLTPTSENPSANGDAPGNSSGGAVGSTALPTPSDPSLGGAPSAAAPCLDEYPLGDGYSCEQQVAWGKCAEPWMANACDRSCGRCTSEPPTNTGSSGAVDCGLSPADPNASNRTKELLCFLKNSQFVSGQTDIDDAVKVEGMTGRYPAIVAFDFYHYTDGDTSETNKAIAWHKEKKGIVAFQWHWKAPGGGEFYADYAFENALGDASSKLYADIDLVAKEIKKMGDAGVPVLYRPLHESNNNFMWWAKRGADNYKKLFRLIYERTLAAGAHDVVWVYNGMASGQSKPLSDYYPGDDVVDVISSDYFQSWSDYSTMADIGTAKNKVLAIAETFNALDPASDPPFSYSIVWASRDWGGKGAEGSWSKAMSSSTTISLENLPTSRGF